MQTVSFFTFFIFAELNDKEMYTIKPFLLFFCVFLLIGCSADEDFSRVYAEGKVELQDVAYNDVSLSIKSGDKISATTVLNPNGNFILSGPLYSREFSLVSSHKLQAFSASKVGCSISEDSLSISIPAGITHIIFHSIKLQE